MTFGEISGDTAWAGGCLCGAVRYTVSGAPIGQSLCYCDVCQTIAGGSPSGLVAANSAEFAIESGDGDLGRFPLTSDAGNPVVRAFCRTCGTHMFTELPLKPERIVVKAGTLDERAAFKPALAIFRSSAQTWHEPQFANGMPAFERGFVAREIGA